VPNPWYGILPWGADGIVIAIVAIVVIAVFKVAIVFLIVKIIKLGILLKEGNLQRSYVPSFVSKENFTSLTWNILEALDKYNEIIDQE